ncbi:ABC transporter permease subunit [Paenibacillus sp. FSL W7-1279]|uniref:ABC transporter permease subunit n=1 Tax=unclassified Paenibacillus TaxID=185978 RepID=UPI001F3E68EF|nr:ABC transporter permease subunit [Paenibacillus sp. JZ16]
MNRAVHRTIPKSLDEAALVDGEGYFYIVRHVIFPLSKSAVIVVALFQFLGVWNDFLGPLVYINKESKFTLALGAIYWLLHSSMGVVDGGGHDGSLSAYYAVYIRTKYFIKGIAVSGLKD